jgi:hypothetical protein
MCMYACVLHYIKLGYQVGSFHHGIDLVLKDIFHRVSNLQSHTSTLVSHCTQKRNIESMHTKHRVVISISCFDVL